MNHFRILFVISLLALSNLLYAKDLPVTINGLLEVEISQSEDYQGVDTGDIANPTAELYVSSSIDNWDANVNFLYDNSTAFDVEEAFLTYNKDATIAFAAGRKIIPFGAFSTNLLTDPLTLTMFETHESILQLLWQGGIFNASVYTFNGDRDVDTEENDIRVYGGEFNFAWKSGDNSIDGGIHYLNNLSETDTFEQNITSLKKRVGGYAVNLAMVFGAININGEYFSADKKYRTTDLLFKNKGATPSAYHVELGYNFEIVNKNSNLTIAHASTMEAQALGQPESRLIVCGNMQVSKSTTVFLEYLQNSDYKVAAGGTDKDSTTYTAKISYNF